MSDPFRPDDELVNAVLDGEATPDERARVEGDPTLRARLEELRAVSDLVGSPPPSPDDAQRERAIAAAKAAVGQQAEVRTLPDRRRQEVPRFLATAAAVLVLLLGAGFLVSRLGDDDDSGAGDTAARLEEGGEESADSAAAGGADTEASPDDAAEADAPEPSELAVSELGPVADEAELYTALAAASDAVARDADVETLDEEAAATTSAERDLPDAEGDSEQCQVGLDEADPGLSGILLEATAEYAGTPAVVYLYGTVDGSQRVVVVSADACEVLTTFDL